MLEKLEECYQNLAISHNDEDSILERIKELLLNLADYDLNKIYLRNDVQLTYISQRMFGSYDAISKSLCNELKSTINRKSKKESDEAFAQRLSDIIKSQDSISIGAIDSALNSMSEEYRKSVPINEEGNKTIMNDGYICF